MRYTVHSKCGDHFSIPSLNRDSTKKREERRISFNWFMLLKHEPSGYPCGNLRAPIESQSIRKAPQLNLSLGYQTLPFASRHQYCKRKMANIKIMRITLSKTRRRRAICFACCRLELERGYETRLKREPYG